MSEVGAYAVSWRRRQGIAGALPPGVRSAQRAMPARPLHQAWAHMDFPPVEWFVGPVDVVHGTNFVVPPTRRAAQVVTVHDLTPLRYPELCDAPTLAFPNLVRRALRRGAWVHTHSDFVAGEVIEAFGVGPERVRAIAPGVPEVGPGPSLEMAARRSVALPAGTDRYVLAIGTAEPRKDLPGLVAAFDDLAAQHQDVALVLVGPEGWGTTALDRAVGAARHADRIVRTGWVSDAELGGLLRGAAVLAYPSLYEGFGLPPLQAMAAGVPVVASRAGAVPEALGDAAALVPVGDRGALADALAHVLDSGAERASLIARGVQACGPLHLGALCGGARPALSGRAGGPAVHRRRPAMRKSAPQPEAVRRVEPRVLLVVEQLRRDVPGGIGTYARGLLQGLAAIRASEAGGRTSTQNGYRDDPDEPHGRGSLALGLLASRPHRPGRTGDPLGRFGWPVYASRLPGRLLTRAWDRGLVGAPRGYDVVHAVSQAAPPVRSRPGQRRPALVVTIHDLAWRHGVSTTPRGRRWHEASLGRALEHADALVVPSEPVASDLVDAGAHRSSVHVIGEGTDHVAAPDAAGASELLARHGVVGGYLLSVCTLEPRKNLAGLVQAYQVARPSLPDGLPLVIVGPRGWGDGPVDPQNPNRRTSWSELLASPGVVHVGPVGQEVLAALYAAARAFVYVPYAEGFGLPPVEAMRLGAPVVASVRVPSVSTSPGAPPTALLVDPFDTSAIAAALVRVTTDDVLRGALVTAGTADATHRTWRVAAEAHVALWTSLARGEWSANR